MLSALRRFVWEIVCLARVVCPDCGNSTRAPGGLVWMFCQNQDCSSLRPETYNGPERRK